MRPTPPMTHAAHECEAELRHLYARSGPFTTVLLRSEADVSDTADDLPARWSLLRTQCETAGATTAALDAIEDAVLDPEHQGIGAIYVCAAADGHTVVDAGEEGPDEDFFHVGELPYAAPLLEWQAWRVPHAIVALAGDGQPIDVVTVVDQEHTHRSCASTDELIALSRELASEHGIELAVVTGPSDDDVRRATALLEAWVPLDVDVAIVTAGDIDRVGDLPTAAVRQVADHVARRTVRCLEDFRFLLEHGGAAQGINATLRSLSAGWGDLLLIHDDPTDPRSAWFGPTSFEISHEPVDGWTRGRLVDVAIRTAIQTGVRVRIIPSTGPDGPDDDLCLLKTEISPSPEDPLT